MAFGARPAFCIKSQRQLARHHWLGTFVRYIVQSLETWIYPLTVHQFLVVAIGCVQFTLSFHPHQRLPDHDRSASKH
jgi:hypothetical protein